MREKGWALLAFRLSLWRRGTACLQPGARAGRRLGQASAVGRRRRTSPSLAPTANPRPSRPCMLAARRALTSAPRLPLGRRASAAMAPPSATPTIGTHSGSFHCDEALGIALLRRTPAFAGAAVVRSRDPKALAACDVVIDVGGVYDPGAYGGGLGGRTARDWAIGERAAVPHPPSPPPAAANMFDHHQREFAEVFGHGAREEEGGRGGGERYKHAPTPSPFFLSQGFTTKLSSAGLVYKHYGRAVVAAIMADADVANPSPEDVETVYLAAYKKFIEAVDAVDNGVSQFDTAALPRYVDGTGLAARVGALNPAWNEGWGPAALDAGFEKASALAGEEFAACVRSLARAWLPARALVVAALDGAGAVDASGEIVELHTACPWKEHLFALEGERSTPGAIKFVLYPDGASGGWRVQAVPVGPVRGERGWGVEARACAPLLRQPKPRSSSLDVVHQPGLPAGAAVRPARRRARRGGGGARRAGRGRLHPHVRLHRGARDPGGRQGVRGGRAGGAGGGVRRAEPNYKK